MEIVIDTVTAMPRFIHIVAGPEPSLIAVAAKRPIHIELDLAAVLAARILALLPHA